MHRLDEAEHRLGIHAVRVDHLAVLDAALDLLLVGLHQIERPGFTPLTGDVHQDHGVVAAHHLVGEVEPAGAEVQNRDSGGELSLAEAPDDLAPEPIVLEPGVADAGHQNLPLPRRTQSRSSARASGSTSPAPKK